jgi:hypothetical protein
LPCFCRLRRLNEDVVQTNFAFHKVFIEFKSDLLAKKG